MNMKQIIYKHEAISSFMTAEMWKSTLQNTYTQNQPAISWKKKFVLF